MPIITCMQVGIRYRMTTTNIVVHDLDLNFQGGQTFQFSILINIDWKIQTLMLSDRKSGICQRGATADVVPTTDL